MALAGRETLRLKLPLGVVAGIGAHWLKRKLVGGDEYDWSTYNRRYRAEMDAYRRQFTDDLTRVPFVVEKGRIFLIGDALPLHPAHRCVLEAVMNLALASVAEIGCGGGKFLTGLKAILGPKAALAGYDLDRAQLAYFRSLYPEAAAAIPLEQLDITAAPIPRQKRPEVVFLSTVLMHIQRPEAYRAALTNVLDSATRAVVIMDNYAKHDYFGDLWSETARRGLSDALWLYDTGNARAVVVSLAGVPRAPYRRLSSASQLA